MAMFPSNQPATERQPVLPRWVYSDKYLQSGLIVCYLLIVLTWLILQLITILYPQLIYDGVVVAAYLFRNQILTNSQVGPDPILQTLDLYLKIILLLLNGFVGTMFLLIYVLPRVQNKNIWILSILIVLGYCIPLLNHLWNIFKNNDLANYLTVNKVLMVVLNAPLTWSLILFGYYLYEELKQAESRQSQSR